MLFEGEKNRKFKFRRETENTNRPRGLVGLLPFDLGMVENKCLLRLRVSGATEIQTAGGTIRVSLLSDENARTE